MTGSARYSRYFTDSDCMYLVLQVNGRVEVRNLGVYRLAEHLVFAVVHEFTHF
jgi:hypothetical protein